MIVVLPNQPTFVTLVILRVLRDTALLGRSFWDAKNTKDTTKF